MPLPYLGKTTVSLTGRTGISFGIFNLPVLVCQHIVVSRPDESLDSDEVFSLSVILFMPFIKDVIRIYYKFRGKPLKKYLL